MSELTREAMTTEKPKLSDLLHDNAVALQESAYLEYQLYDLLREEGHEELVMLGQARSERYSSLARTNYRMYCLAIEAGK